MAATLRVEHIAETPRGWRVRTVKRDAHRVRVAFPPGRRKPGSGKVVEILHPKTEKNPRCAVSEKAKKNPAELLIFGNPTYVHFTFNGREYRTDGKTVEGKDGATWNRTGSLPVVLAGRKAWAEKRNPAHVGQRTYSFYGKKFKAHTEAEAKRRALKWYNKKGGRAAKRSLGTNPNSKRQFKVYVRGRYKYFQTLDAAKKFADEIFRKTKIVLGIEKANPPKMRGNPSEQKEAIKLFESFHGKDAKEIVEKQVSAAMRLDYAALGDLEKLIVITPQGDKVEFNFEGDGVKLASSPDGKQLYCIGGNQNIAKCLDAKSLEKDLIDLGECVQVEYLARKIHANYEPVTYYHKMGEKTGDRPRLMYDKLRKQIFFAGGAYFINTDKGVSPGIEN